MPKKIEKVDIILRYFIPPETDTENSGIILSPHEGWGGRFVRETIRKKGERVFTYEIYSKYRKARENLLSNGWTETLLPGDIVCSRRFVWENEDNSTDAPKGSWTVIEPSYNWKGDITEINCRTRKKGSIEDLDGHSGSYPYGGESTKKAEDFYWKTIDEWKSAGWKEIPYFSNEVTHGNGGKPEVLRSFSIVTGKKKVQKVTQIWQDKCNCGCNSYIMATRVFLPGKEKLPPGVNSTAVIKSQKDKIIRSSYSLKAQYGKAITKLLDAGWGEVDSITLIPKPVKEETSLQITLADYFFIKLTENITITRGFTEWSSGSCENICFQSGGYQRFTFNPTEIVSLLLGLVEVSRDFTSLPGNLKGRLARKNPDNSMEDVFILKYASTDFTLVLTRELWLKLGIWKASGQLDHNGIIVKTEEKDNTRIRVDVTTKGLAYIFLPPDKYCILYGSDSTRQIHVYTWTAAPTFFDKGTYFQVRMTLPQILSCFSVDPIRNEDDDLLIRLTEKGLDRKLDKIRVWDPDYEESEHMEVHRGTWEALSQWRNGETITEADFAFLSPEYSQKLEEEAFQRRLNKRFSLADIFEMD